MPALSLRYDHCALRKPHYLKKSAIETVASEARAQLLPPGEDALTLAQLAAISDLTINGLPYQLWVSLDHPISDEDGQPVLGLCEFDPDCGEDAVSVLVSPVGEQLTSELALSTFAHELGHAIFDAPAWLIASNNEPDLFGGLDVGQCRAYRTATPDAEHLGSTALPQNTTLEKEIRIAEFRANEFMGSLLVPRDRLVELAVARAPDFDVGIERDDGLSAELLAATPRLVEQGTFGFLDMENLQRALAATFGVNPKFIRVRMERYGLLLGKGQG